MSKDPALLWYPSDWISGTMGMTFEEKGAYMELLMLQFNRGHMTSDMIARTVGQMWDTISEKFVIDSDGKYYNERLEEERIKRKSFTDSRKNNLKGNNQYTKLNKKLGHTSSRMEDVNINDNINENKDYSFYLDLFSKIEIDVWEKLTEEQKGERFDLISTELLNSESWLINISRNFKIDYDKLKKHLDEFIKDIQLKTDLSNTFPKIKDYFVNWVKKKNTNINTNQQKSTSQKIDEAVANITLD